MHRGEAVLIGASHHERLNPRTTQELERVNDLPGYLRDHPC
jgi:hypothetical protein